MNNPVNQYNKIIDEQEKLETRETHPEGNFDNKRRFYLHKNYDCCQTIRIPSAAFPFSEMSHGRTLVHVAHKYGMEHHLSAIKVLKNAWKNKGIRFKSVSEVVRASKAKRKSPKKLVAQKILHFWAQLEAPTGTNN